MTGFKNLDDLRAIVMNYAEFRTGEQVGLKLPQPDVRQVRVPMNELQEEKYDKIVAKIERLMEMAGRDKDMAGRLQFKILGLLQRLSAIALHPLLDEGYDASNALTGGIITETTIGADGAEVVTKRALPPPDFAAPKLLACAERVVASPGCGHIIFCESLAAQIWMREVLVSKGVPRERIAIINGSVSTGDRVRIAREFNGQSGEPPAPGTCGGGEDKLQTPEYDALLLNIVGQEGIDLQVRTCAIHHLDMTWTPSDLEQRNGRAVRQGNTLETIQIFYYLSDRSMDWYRYALVAGKRGWLVSLLDSQARDTNNPGAQQQLSTEDILLLISRDEEKTKKKLEERREQRQREALLKVAREAAALLQQASARFRDARETRDYVRAAKLRAEGETRLADLARVSAEAWPWGRWAEAAREFEVIVPPNGGAPVHEGLRMRVPAGMMVGPQHARFVEFGRVVPIEGGVGIGVRAMGGGSWIVVTPARIERLGVAPEDLLAGFPEDEAALRPAIEAHILGALGKGEGWEGLGQREAADAWLVRWWPTIEAALLAGMKSGAMEDELLPAVQEDRLVLRPGGELGDARLLPPTRAGWERFLSLAPESGEKFMALRAVGERYWLRKIPRDLLSRAAGEDDADAEAAEKAPAHVAEPAPTLTPLAASVEPAANAAPPAEAARPPGRVGHVYRVGGRWYGDTSLMRALEGPFRLSHLSYGDFEAKGDAGAIRLFRYSDEALFPEQEGRLHTLSYTGGDEALGALLEKLTREGSVQIVGSFEEMPSKEPPPAPPAPAFGEIRNKEDLTRALEMVGDGPQEWASRGEWDRLREYDGPGQDIVARAYTWVLAHKRDLYAQSIDGMELTRERKDAFKQALVDAHDAMLGVAALDAILRRARDAQVAQAGADAATSRQARALESARTRLRGLGLPAAVEKSYLKKIERALADGKSPDRLLRNAAKKATAIKRDEDRRRPPRKLEELPSAGDVPSTWVDHVLDAFNAEPGPQVAPVRPRANGYVFVVHAEGGSPASPLASIDVLDGQVEDVRWLDERLSSAARDVIVERLERALEEVDGEELEEGEAPRSPLDDLVRRLARKAQTLGADPTKIGKPEIANLLKEFAEPEESSVRGFETWLEDNHLIAAGETVGQARGEDPPPVSVLVRDLWDAIMDELRIETVAKGEAGLRVYFDAVFDLEDSRGGRFGYMVLHTGDKHQLQLAKVRVTGEEDDGDVLVVEDLGGLVADGTEVYANHHERGLEFFRELFRRAGLFEDTLRRAPRLLADVRALLYWTTLLVEGPRCQGATRRAAMEALTQARRYYDLARTRLVEGRSVDAVTRMQDALRRVSAAAALVGESCGEGQIDLVPARIDVREDDRQVLEGEEN